MTALGEKNRLGCQTIPVLSTVLALLALPDVLTIPTFRELEQLFLKMRIAVIALSSFAAPPCCLRFSPSPYLTHDDERLTTMASADFCPITPSVSTRHAV